jgi:hypothetical protein
MTSTLHFPGRSGEDRDVLVARLAASPHAPESADVPVDGIVTSDSVGGRVCRGLRRFRALLPRP